MGSAIAVLRKMLRLGLLVSVVPLVLAGGIAPGLLPGDRHLCIAAGSITVQMARLPWQADLHVAFTGNPGLATVRVQLVDQPEIADFVVADDVDAVDEVSCTATAEMRRVSIVSKAADGEPTIYLSTEPTADYRIFVHSRSLTAQEAAALIVGARGGRTRIASASAFQPR